jgi:hypothetical protein
MRSVFLLTTLVFVALAAGCGKSGPKGVPVSGRITMDKRPLAGADVTFSPKDSSEQAALEASGKTDEDGRYTLKRNKDGGEGVPAGLYVVRVSLINREAPSGKIQQIPAAYNSTTKLSFNVPEEGSKEANFELSSTGK